MFDVKGLEIQMYEGDFGEQLPINIVKGEVLEGDILKFIIQDKRHNDIINKELEPLEDSFIFSLNENETKLLKEDTYLWGLKQYRENYLIDTLTANNIFKVERGQ